MDKQTTDEIRHIIQSAKYSEKSGIAEDEAVAAIQQIINTELKAELKGIVAFQSAMNDDMPYSIGVGPYIKGRLAKLATPPIPEQKESRPVAISKQEYVKLAKEVEAIVDEEADKLDKILHVQNAVIAVANRLNELIAAHNHHIETCHLEVPQQPVKCGRCAESPYYASVKDLMLHNKTVHGL
jgi:hypothetical protein